MSYKSELKKGIKVEMEHSHLFPQNLKRTMAEKIAKDHIKEFPKYYSKGLLPMEKSLSRHG